MKLRQFIEADNIEYSTWFRNEILNRWIGPAWSQQELDARRPLAHCSNLRLQLPATDQQTEPDHQKFQHSQGACFLLWCVHRALF